MLSGIPAQRLWRPRPTADAASSSNLDASAGSTSDRRPFTSIAQIHGSEVAELKSLNSSLACLASIFPDVQPEVFREMLSTFSDESRLQLVTECLLKHKAKWVKGRWRVSDPCKSGSNDTKSAQRNTDDPLLTRKERFRSSDYKMAVKEAFYQEFKNMSHSTIKAILAEHNFSYIHSRRALVALMSKSWRVSVTNMILRRKIPSIEEIPLIRWHQPSMGEPVPVLVNTKSQELNDELELDIITPLRAKQLDQQLESDRALANNINEEEAETVGALYECQCCFIPNTFERISVCDLQDHFICFRCIRNAMNEALFGQGWASSINSSKCSMSCISLAFGSSSKCTGCLPRESVRRALLSEDQGQEIWKKFENRTATDDILQSRLPVAACPFCPYAEVNDPNSQSSRYALLEELYRYLPVLILGSLIFPLNPLFGVVIYVLAGIYFKRRLKRRRKEGCFRAPEANTLNGLNFGIKFICRNASCLRSSCLNCLAPWIDTHICHQSSRQALRTYIESAVTEAIKRTCPKCNLSFVKSSGCNKLVCVCGYSMCYVCRQDVGKEGYSHFCPHFRTNPGQACEECDRCDLYRTEDDEKVISKAKQDAIAAWKEQRQGSDDPTELVTELDDREVSPDVLVPKRRRTWLFA